MEKNKSLFVYKLLLNKDTPSILGNPVYTLYEHNRLKCINSPVQSDPFIICIFQEQKNFPRYFLKGYKEYKETFTIGEKLMVFSNDKIPSLGKIKDFFINNFSVNIYNFKFFQFTIKNIYEKVALFFIRDEVWPMLNVISPNCLFFRKSKKYQEKIDKNVYEPVRTLGFLQAYYTKNAITGESSSFFQLLDGLPTSFNYQTSNRNQVSGFNYFKYYYRRNNQNYLIIANQDQIADDQEIDNEFNFLVPLDSIKIDKYFVNINYQYNENTRKTIYYYPTIENPYPEENKLYAKHESKNFEEIQSKAEDVQFILPIKPLYYECISEYLVFVFSKNIQNDRNINELIQQFPTIFKINHPTTTQITDLKILYY